VAESDGGAAVREKLGSDPCIAEVVAVVIEAYADLSDGSDAWEDAVVFLFIEPSSTGNEP
jgi:hypothetical protein